MRDWIIDIEQKGRGAAGLRDAYGYMKDPNRPSHYHTDITVIGNDRAFQNTVLEFDSLKQRGRKNNNFATSAMLSMPKDLIHPTVEQWENIADELLKNYVDEVNSLQDRKLKAVKTDQELIEDWNKKQIEKGLQEFTQDEIEKKLTRKRNDEAKYLNQRLDLETVKETTGLIIHKENNGKASHLNVLISNIQNGESKKVITQYGGVNALKKAYNQAVKDVLGLDNRYYTPEESRLEGQLAYDPKVKFDRKELKPETVERNGETVRKKRRRKKPFSVAQAEKKEAERMELLEFANDNMEQFEANMKTRDLIVEKKELILEKAEQLKDKSKSLNDKEKGLNEKEEILNKKESKIEKLKSLLDNAQKDFKNWLKALGSSQKQELEQLAIASADTILEMEKVAPVQAKRLTGLAEHEERKAELLEEFAEESKVTHQVKTRRKSGRGNRM